MFLTLTLIEGEFELVLCYIKVEFYLLVLLHSFFCCTKEMWNRFYKLYWENICIVYLFNTLHDINFKMDPLGLHQCQASAE